MVRLCETLLRHNKERLYLTKLLIQWLNINRNLDFTVHKFLIHEEKGVEYLIVRGFDKTNEYHRSIKINLMELENENN